jgi:multisubunit Na+/H+ antiporter MnhF subunit
MSGLENGVIAVALLLMASSVALGLVRLFLGPTGPDRVVAADTLAVITTAGLVWFASASGRSIYLDIALVYGALAFVGVVALARAVEGDRE